MANDYYLSKESVDEYIRMAEGVHSEELIAKLHACLPEKSSLLEIGSGPGSDFQILKSRYKVVGSDFSEEFLGRLRTNYPQGEFLKLNAITLESERKFDGIYSNKVLQHLTNEELKISFARQSAILNQGGIVCHSFWKGEGDEMFKGMYVNYQTDESLRALFSDYFEVLSIDEYNEFEEGDSLLIIGKKIQK